MTAATELPYRSDKYLTLGELLDAYLPAPAELVEWAKNLRARRPAA